MSRETYISYLGHLMIMHWLSGEEFNRSATEVLLDYSANLFKMLKK